MKTENRRGFLKVALGTAAGLVIARNARANDLRCESTPAEVMGPFVPDDFPFHELNGAHPHILIAEQDADFTKIADHKASATGQIIYVQGQIVDENCKPIPSARVFVWQADDNGHYNHSNDPNLVNPAKDLDANFQYRGIVDTDAEGRFQVKTIKPKYYPLDPSRTEFVRTAHLHVAVMKEGFVNLSTQIYFEGDALKDIAEIRRLNKIDILLGEWRGERGNRTPLGRINPAFMPLVVNYREQKGFDAPVGQIRISLTKS